MVDDDTVREFFRDDEGYLEWLAAHPDGYVINISAAFNTKDARLHHARCHTINGRLPGASTGPTRTGRCARPSW